MTVLTLLVGVYIYVCVAANVILLDIENLMGRRVGRRVRSENNCGCIEMVCRNY